jgi:hypothetical protein
MSRPVWAILVAGELSRIEALVKEYFEGYGIDASAFAISPGRGRYHVVLPTLARDFGTENPLGKDLAEQTDEPVFAISNWDDPTILVFRRGGKVSADERDPDELAESLGCSLPQEPEPEPLYRYTVARIEGVTVAEAKQAYRASFGRDAGDYLHFDAVTGAVLLHADNREMGFADISISEELPAATVYGVTTSAELTPFFVQILRGGETFAHFDAPAQTRESSPAVEDIKGEREPAAILAALEIPVELFRRRG